MDEAEEYAQFREALLRLVNSINAEIPLQEHNQVLIVYLLDNPDKIVAFNNWIIAHLKGGKLQATETEIVRAAVQASKSIDNNH